MQIDLSDEAFSDLQNGYWFYEFQEVGVGDYFRSSVSADIDSLVIHGGSHMIVHGYHRMVCKTFPYNVYYEMAGDTSLLVVAVIHQSENRKPKQGCG